jgi:hypothetical protein
LWLWYKEEEEPVGWRIWLTLTPRPTLVLWWVDEKGLLELDGFWADEEKTEEIGLIGSLATELTRVDDTCSILP